MSYHNRIGRRVAPAGSYHKLSISEKQGLVRGADREPPVACPYCGTVTTSSDLLSHIERGCDGPRRAEHDLEPQKHWQWVDWRRARALGVPATTLSFWARTGQVRYLGGEKKRRDRKYLLRDLALKVAQRRVFRRR